MNRHSTIMSWTAQRKYTVIITALLLFTLAATGLWAQALPPDIQADQYLLAAKKQLEAQNYAGAAEYFEKILALGVKVPTEFYYHYGKALLNTNRFNMAEDLLKKYVTIDGRSGRYYQQSLELLTDLEQSKKIYEIEQARKREEKERIERTNLQNAYSSLKGTIESWSYSADYWNNRYILEITEDGFLYKTKNRFFGNDFRKGWWNEEMIGPIPWQAINKIIYSLEPIESITLHFNEKIRNVSAFHHETIKNYDFVIDNLRLSSPKENLSADIQILIKSFTTILNIRGVKYVCEKAQK